MTPNGTQIIAEPFVVHFNGKNQVKTELVFALGGENGPCWVHGDFVDDIIEDGGASEEDRIQMLKLCIEGSERTQHMRAKVARQIAALPLAAKEQLRNSEAPEPEDLMAMFLKLPWNDTQAHINSHYGKRDGKTVFDSFPLEIWLSVPKLWSPQMNEVMVSAATWADMRNVHLVQ